MMLCKEYFDHLIPDKRFEEAVKVILEHEGGLENNTLRDPGSVTQWGISLRFLQSIGLDINHDGRVNADDVRDLTLTDAKAIYRKYWWDKYHYEAIEDNKVVAKIFDLAVNDPGILKNVNVITDLKS